MLLIHSILSDHFFNQNPCADPLFQIFFTDHPEDFLPQFYLFIEIFLLQCQVIPFVRILSMIIEFFHAVSVPDISPAPGAVGIVLIQNTGIIKVSDDLNMP